MAVISAYINIYQYTMLIYIYIFTHFVRLPSQKHRKKCARTTTTTRSLGSDMFHFGKSHDRRVIIIISLAARELKYVVFITYIYIYTRVAFTSDRCWRRRAPRRVLCDQWNPIGTLNIYHVPVIDGYTFTWTCIMCTKGLACQKLPCFMSLVYQGRVRYLSAPFSGFSFSPDLGNCGSRVTHLTLLRA